MVQVVVLVSLALSLACAADESAAPPPTPTVTATDQIATQPEDFAEFMDVSGDLVGEWWSGEVTCSGMRQAFRIQSDAKREVAILSSREELREKGDDLIAVINSLESLIARWLDENDCGPQ